MELRIEKAIYGGSGLARIPASAGEHGGKTIFVPLTLPGELVEAHVAEDRRSFVNGKLDAVLEPSPARTDPGCVYFPGCGGCQYQHAMHAGQLEMKLAILRETLGRAGVPAPETIDVAAGEPWGYRNRIRLHVRTFSEFSLCYRESGSHREIAVNHCPIAAPILQRALAETVEAARVLRILNGTFKEIEFFTNADESALLISLWSRRAKEAIATLPLLCAVLQERLPALRGASLFATDEAKARGALLASWGDNALDYAVGEHNYHVSAGSFFQVNRFLVPRLLSLVTEGRSGTLAWDLYAGVGLFARALSRIFERVVAVEAAPSSSADLRRNIPGSQHRIVVADTLRFLQTESHRKIKPDLLVVDPPRAGLGKQICNLVSGIQPREIVYVSCDPATLARDLAALIDLRLSGYRLTKLTLVDLFPQTFHLESVAVLTHE